MTPRAGSSLAIVGGGWAGLAAAVCACEDGRRVTLFEMSAHWGGRARRVDVDGLALDNGQHILIGAYTRTLALMATVGVDVGTALHRQPLELRYPDGRGLRMPDGPAWLGFGAAVLGCVGWRWRDRWSLLAAAAGWALRGFTCAPHLTVAELTRSLPQAVKSLLVDPLCVAALNTPARDASASVFLRVLRDAIFGGHGSSDLLLPRRDLGALVPQPAIAWLAQHGATLKPGHRVQQLARHGAAWEVDGELFDAVLLACSAHEAARLARPHVPEWSENAAAVAYEPIITVYLLCAGARLRGPMMALPDGPDAPAQFVFDHGAIGGSAGVFAFVASGARAWLDRGLAETARAVLDQASRDFPPGTWPVAPTLLRVLAEKRATFSCRPNLKRPAAALAAQLAAAGDYVEGPYPATLEGAVRSADAALAALRATPEAAGALVRRNEGASLPPPRR